MLIRAELTIKFIVGIITTQLLSITIQSLISQFLSNDPELGKVTGFDPTRAASTIG